VVWCRYVGSDEGRAVGRQNDLLGQVVVRADVYSVGVGGVVGGSASVIIGGLIDDTVAGDLFIISITTDILNIDTHS